MSRSLIGCVDLLGFTNQSPHTLGGGDLNTVESQTAALLPASPQRFPVEGREVSAAVCPALASPLEASRFNSVAIFPVFLIIVL